MEISKKLLHRQLADVVTNTNVGKYKIEDFDFEPSSCLPIPPADSLRTFFILRTFHTRLKWNFTPIRYHPVSSYPRRKKILRPTKRRVKETQISNIRERRSVATLVTEISRPAFRRESKSPRFVSSGIFLQPSRGEKKEQVNYVCEINNRGGEKIGRWRIKVRVAEAKEPAPWKRYEQCCYAKLSGVSVVDRSRLYMSKLSPNWLQAELLSDNSPRQNSS